ncbi:hypothetical protein Sa4125_16770 [Aureimonas sp. SA4125]|nr:hypothetical protein Sa4125_16770 [Aureimonas sp. SA4125]
MPLPRSPSTAPDLLLPPPYTLHVVREVVDPFSHAREIASAAGAGTLIWARRFHLAEFALVLEPEEPLAPARRVAYAAGNALCDALSSHAPAQVDISLDWPDAIRVDGALVGGLRLAWPEGTPEDAVPAWLVLGVTIRLVVMQAGEAGLRPLLGGLDEQGFEDLNPGMLVEGFARTFLRETNVWAEEGFEAVRLNWLHRWRGEAVEILDDGDMLSDGSSRSLGDALTTVSWLDPATGTPWI